MLFVTWWMDISNHPHFSVCLQSESMDFEATMADLKESIQVLIDMSLILGENKILLKSWRKYMELQSMKFIFHTSSLANLFHGSFVGNLDKPIHDLGSIFLLRRAQIENYLMFYYLNIQPQSDKEGELRQMFFELGGLTHRQQYNAVLDENIEKKKNEAIEIDLLLDSIKENDFFKTLHKAKQNHLLEKRPSKILGWESLIESSHLKTEYALPLWKYYSNFAHSEMIGIIQIRDYLVEPEKLFETLFYTLEQTLVLTSIMIDDFKTNFVDLQGFYKNLPIELRNKIDFWTQIGKKN